jgi:hypothetical protein
MQNTLLPHSASGSNRHLSFEGCFNFRDLGGYATADGRVVPWRRFFRSMTPQWMTASDAGEALQLGIETVIDFRGLDHASSGPIGEPPARRLTLGFRREEFRDSADMQVLLNAAAPDGLPLLLDLYAPHFARAMTEILQTQGASLFHCQLGKDRTGVFAALLLQTLGVSDNDIVADYMLTAAREPLCRALIDAHGATYKSVQSARFVREPVQPEAMQAVLHKVWLVYNDAKGYFLAHGVDEAALDAWVERILEPAV